jgi:hypothetical protein
MRGSRCMGFAEKGSEVFGVEIFRSVLAAIDNLLNGHRDVQRDVDESN